jgi:hypothetical protein
LGFPTGRSLTSLITHTITAPSISFSGTVAGDNEEEEEEAPTSTKRQQNATSFSGAITGEEENFCKGSFARTSFTLF